MVQFWFIEKNIKLLLKLFSTSFYITQILFVFSSCFSNIGNVNELVHNVSVLMLLVVNVFLGTGKILITMVLDIFLSSEKFLT